MKKLEELNLSVGMIIKIFWWVASLVTVAFVIINSYNKLESRIYMQENKTELMSKDISELEKTVIEVQDLKGDIKQIKTDIERIKKNLSSK